MKITDSEKYGSIVIRMSADGTEDMWSMVNSSQSRDFIFPVCEYQYQSAALMLQTHNELWHNFNYHVAR